MYPEENPGFFRIFLDGRSLKRATRGKSLLELWVITPIYLKLLVHVLY